MPTLQPTSPRAYLDSIVSGLLPQGERYEITEQALAGGTFVIDLTPLTSRASGILMGKGAVTLEAIRRLMICHATSRGWRVMINFNPTERNPNRVEEISAV